MTVTALEEARIAVFDPVALNRQATAVSLYEVGFRSIETPKTIEDLRLTLEERLFDLLILETTSFQDEIVEVIADMRQERMGDNVFALILATAWTLDDRSLERILRSGADDLLKRPFSINQIAGRVGAFIKARKPFLVSRSYIGPNHFDGALALVSQDIPDGRDVTVPNTLSGRTGPDRQYYDAKREITQARVAIRQVLIAIELEHMEAGIDALARTQTAVAAKIEDGLLPPALLDRFHALKAVAHKIAPLAEEAALAEVAELTRAMLSILPQSAKIQAIPVKAVLALMPQMAKAIRLCIHPRDTDRALASEIIEKVDFFLKVGCKT